MIKIKGLSAEDLNGFMDEGTEFNGELRFRDTFRIDGRLKGRIVSDNTLIVGESGQVEADIDCGVVSIRGAVSGRVQGRQRIEVLAGARVQATLVFEKAGSIDVDYAIEPIGTKAAPPAPGAHSH